MPLNRGSRNCPWSVRRLFLRSLLVDAAKRLRESRIGRISAATQDSRALCRFALGATRPIRGASDCGNRTSTRGQHHRGAEERDEETRGTDNSSTGAPRYRAAQSVLGLCFIPIIRLSPLVLIVRLRSLYKRRVAQQNQTRLHERRLNGSLRPLTDGAHVQFAPRGAPRCERGSCRLGGDRANLELIV